MTSQIARRLVILGAPGSGKGTIASRIVKTYGMPHIVVGDLLRQHIQRGSGKIFLYCFFNYFYINNRFVLIFKEESKIIKQHIDKGLLLPDDLVLKFVAGELQKIRDKGFLLDGIIYLKNIFCFSFGLFFL